MTNPGTHTLIFTTAKRLFATHGYDGVSMRILAKESGVGLSSIYHFFKDKDILLETIYAATNRQLGLDRAALPVCDTAEAMLAQLIEFQFQHIEDVVYVLKYYLQFRDSFANLPTKTLPEKSVLHVEEVIRKGIETGELAVDESQIEAKARVVSHTINGYLLEYYPTLPTEHERRQIRDDIVAFAMAGLHNN